VTDPNGEASIKWHADDEKWYYCEGRTDMVIASVSLGAERWFELRSDPRKMRGADRRSVRIRLKSGSLLLMAGATQKLWQHCLPRDAVCTTTRYNLTFRRVVTGQEDARLLNVKD
jgi:alkylated DNA repair dioxygenase AlkB